jgi:hypothetical protein
MILEDPEHLQIRSSGAYRVFLQQSQELKNKLWIQMKKKSKLTRCSSFQD